MASQSGEPAHALPCEQAPAVTQAWQAVAVFGSTGQPASAPHDRPHSVSHFEARHALSAETSLGPATA
jgi:hypothetical protein